MRRPLLDTTLLAGKSLLVVLGLLLVMAGLVEFVVGGFSFLALGVTASGLALAGVPLAFAFHQAVKAAREGRYPRED